RFAQICHPFLSQRGEGISTLGVDRLHHSDQLCARSVYDWSDKHLLSAITRTLVNLLQETQLWAKNAQLILVVDIPNVDHATTLSDEARYALVVDREFQILKRREPRFHFGNDRRAIL